jgi:hypothetical protein
VEKLDLLVWTADGADAAPSLLELGVRGLAVSTPAGLDRAPLLMGRGPALLGLVELWVDSVDIWPEVVERVPSDAYLVTESVPQLPPPAPVGERRAELTHLTWFPKPNRLSEGDFFHGWHVVHTPSSAALHPLRQGYVRDAVSRSLTETSPPVRAIVSEHFAVEDYLDPARLFGGKEALDRTMHELPSYADAVDISSCPMWQTVYRTPW